MIDYATFKRIKENHGNYASWAVWADGGRPKENVGDLSMFDVQEGDALLQELNPRIVLVGLNISRLIEFAFGNFHDKRPGSMDYKIRYALKGTALWGAYMTDIIKDFEEKVSGKMMAYLRQHRSFEKENIASFDAEVRDLGVERPILIVFGRDAFEIANRNLGMKYAVWRVPHYSHRTGNEEYRGEVEEVIQQIRNAK